MTYNVFGGTLSLNQSSCKTRVFFPTVAQVDRVTELLNTSPLKPVDPTSVSIELQQCYCVRSVADKLFYRAEVMEICYGDAQCKRAVSDVIATCRCDQLMRLQTTAAKAVRVHSATCSLLLGLGLRSGCDKVRIRQCSNSTNVLSTLLSNANSCKNP